MHNQWVAGKKRWYGISSKSIHPIQFILSGEQYFSAHQHPAIYTPDTYPHILKAILLFQSKPNDHNNPSFKYSL